MKKQLIIIFPLILFIVGCGSSKPTHSKKEVPDWFLMPPQKKGTFYGVGNAKRPQLNLSKKIATSRARDELARQIKSEVQSKISDFQKASGLEMDAEASEFNEYVSGNVVDMSLEYSMIEKTELIDGQVFVLVSYDVQAAKEAAKEAAKAAADRLKAYKSEKEARDAFARLEQSLNKMEGKTGVAPEE